MKYVASSLACIAARLNIEELSGKKQKTGDTQNLVTRTYNKANWQRPRRLITQHY